MGKHEEAIEYGRKIKERYGHSDALLGFLTRYKATTGSTRHDSELNAELKKLFPGGIKKVTLSQLQGRPDSGVIIKEDNQLLQAAGLKNGDLIVALYGIRVHNFEQYGYARASTVDPQMDLLIWRKNQYLQVKASPPDHRFNADFATWPR
jgi:hypothetical protein